MKFTITKVFLTIMNLLFLSLPNLMFKVAIYLNFTS